jgi:hypothetical protein
MSKFVLAYQGGSMAMTEEEIQASMAQWGQWFGDLGAAVLDGGNPFGASTKVTAGGRADAASGITGYSIVDAADLEAAADLAKGCPVLAAGGTVDVYEALDM